MKFKFAVEPVYYLGQTKSRTKFCLFPKSFIVIDRDTRKPIRIIYWLESIEIKEELVPSVNKFLLPSERWTVVEVNGQSVD